VRGVTLGRPVARSLICFALTPNVNYQFNNLTGVPQPNARFIARAVITIENEVPDDPTLIDGIRLYGASKDK
jgi:hypothetical protein